MAIPVTCPACGANLKASENLIGKRVKCPKCANFLFIKGLNIEVEHTEEATVCPVRSAPDSSPRPVPVNPVFTFEAAKRYSEGLKANPRPVSNQFKGYYDIAKFVAAFGLGCITLSPFLSWVNLGFIRVAGIYTPLGLIIFVGTLIASATYAATLIEKRFRLGILLVQGWGTIASLWLSSVVVTLLYVIASLALSDNPFVAIAAGSCSPGFGLYLGVLGGLIIAFSLGFLAVGIYRESGNLQPYVFSQVISICIGIVLAIVNFLPGVNIFTPLGDQKVAQEKSEIPPFKLDLEREQKAKQPKQAPTLAARQISTPQPNSQSQNRQPVSNTPRPPASRPPQQPARQPGWNANAENTNKSDEQFRCRYDIKWYKSIFDEAKDVDYDFFAKRWVLIMNFDLHIEADTPIKDVYGHLAIMKDGRVIYETPIADKNGISFTDSTLIHVKIPYDDSNPVHRTLRFDDVENLKPVFTLQKLVLADGREVIF